MKDKTTMKPLLYFFSILLLVGGLLLGLGMMLTTYLLVVSLQTRGDAAALLLGRARAARR